MRLLLTDMRDTGVHRFHHFDDLTKAETAAIEIMESIKYMLPMGVWGRGEYNATDKVYLEYCERKAVGSARVYIRITETDRVDLCKVCGAIATFETRHGCFCDKPHYK
jgi:hypothetical protein